LILYLFILPKKQDNSFLVATLVDTEEYDKITLNLSRGHDLTSLTIGGIYNAYITLKPEGYHFSASVSLYPVDKK